MLSVIRLSFRKSKMDFLENFSIVFNFFNKIEIQDLLKQNKISVMMFSFRIFLFAK